MATLTNKQRRIASSIYRYMAIHGRSPTIREIATLHGWKHLSYVFGVIQTLVAKGMLTKSGGEHRTMQRAGWVLTTPQGNILPMTDDEATMLLNRLPRRP